MSCVSEYGNISKCIILIQNLGSLHLPIIGKLAQILKKEGQTLFLIEFSRDKLDFYNPESTADSTSEFTVLI